LNSTDENLIYAAAKYMLNFGDHVLLQFVKEFLKSKSKKLKGLAVDIVKKLKLESEDVEIFRIASDKKSNIPLRKKALNVLMEFKAEHLSKVFREIAFDDEEDLSLRELALKGVLYFNPEYIKK
jgi:HEAT repeat protein